MTTSLTRRGLAGMAASAAVAAAAPCASAQAWPTRPVQVIVPYAPGGTGDVFARIVAEKLRGALGQTLVVENRSGASGTIGTQLVVRAAADGYTLLFGQTPEIAIARNFLPDVPYDPASDLAPVALVGNAALALVVNAASPYRSVQELVAGAKARPGAQTFASAGTGTPGHFAAETLARRGGAPMVHVPYRGAGPALADLLGGHVGFFFSGMPAAVPHVREGRLRMLAVSTASRMPSAPETPTVQESGIAEFDFSLWGGFFAPAATPADIVRRLNREVNQILRDPAVRDRLVAEGADVRETTPEEFADFVRTEVTKYGRIITETGVKPA